MSGCFLFRSGFSRFPLPPVFTLSYASVFNAQTVVLILSINSWQEREYMFNCFIKGTYSGLFWHLKMLIWRSCSAIFNSSVTSVNAREDEPRKDHNPQMQLYQLELDLPRHVRSDKLSNVEGQPVSNFYTTCESLWLSFCGPRVVCNRAAFDGANVPAMVFSREKQTESVRV